MTKSPEAPARGLETGVLGIYCLEKQKDDLKIVKILIMLTVFLFSAISLPKQEAKVEPVLTSESLLNIVNQDRIKSGLSPLRQNFKLQRAAKAKALDIFKNNYFAHISPQGIEPWDFIKKEGLPYKLAGENLAINYINPYELESDFLQSASHRNNLLSPLYTDLGIAVVEGIYHSERTVVTVQMFAAPAEIVATNNN